MTGEIVNLRLARKQKLRADRAGAAAANRTLYGRGKADRQMTDQANLRAARTLDGHLREGRQPEDDHLS